MGEKHEECTRCHHQKPSVDIPATGEDHVHGYISEIVPPSCSDDGYTKHTCSCGDTYTDNYTSRLDHTDADNDGICDVCREKTADDDTDSDNPPTGETDIYVYLALLLVSGSAIAVVAYNRKRRQSAR